MKRVAVWALVAAMLAGCAGGGLAAGAAKDARFDVAFEQVAGLQVGARKATKIKSIKIKKLKRPLRVAEDRRLNVTIKYTGPKPTVAEVAVYSTDPNVAIARNLGKQGFWITPYREGNTTIMIECLGKSASITLPVTGFAPTSVSLDRDTLALQKGTKHQLQGAVLPAAANQRLTWKSSKTSVATVNSSGVVSAKKKGVAVITAKSDNGKTARCTVTVQSGAVGTPSTEPTSIVLDKTSLPLTIGATGYINATVNPSTAVDKTVSWTSSNTGVATVSNGTVTAKASGYATITARTSNGLTATCVVEVIGPVEVYPTGIVLNKSTLSLEVGKSGTLIATISPSNTTDRTVTWSSSNTSIATVSNNGTVAAKAAGITTITAKTVNGLPATCTMTVTPAPILPTEITLDQTSVTLHMGWVYKLNPTIIPANAADKTVTWSSSDASVATVSSDGVITPLDFGVATITARTANGLSASCAVSVERTGVLLGCPGGLTLMDTSLSMKIGHTTMLFSDQGVYPSGFVAFAGLTWTSSNPSVVTVSAATATYFAEPDSPLPIGMEKYAGELKAKAAGVATITAQTGNGFRASCVVTVTAS